jgi:hypothetical protein
MPSAKAINFKIKLPDFEVSFAKVFLKPALNNAVFVYF